MLNKGRVVEIACLFCKSVNFYEILRMVCSLLSSVLFLMNVAVVVEVYGVWENV
jgi:hypothetical protein